MKSVRSIFGVVALMSLGLFLLAGCKSVQKVSKSVSEPVVEDHATSPYAFKAGFYYIFDFSDPSVSGFNEKAAIENLIKGEIPVTDIWYKAGARSCRPPGSEMVMTVIVEPVFLVRLNKAYSGMTELGYKLAEEPGLGDCAYTVRHYVY